MTKKTKRIVKTVAKNGAWAISDIFFLAIKAVGTIFMVVLTTAAIFSAIFLIYLRTTISTGLDFDPTTMQMMQSSAIFAICPDTYEEIELVTLQWTEFRHQVTFDEIPDHLIQALVAIEDHRFFRHNGVDWYRTAGAFMNMFLSMRDTFGGSTITQQLIKNLTHDDDVTVQRKLQEIFRALEFERQFSKEEILEMYLNIVYFGHGRLGIGAAAHFYFGKDVSELTLAESAAIIGITNNPSRFSPYANRRANKERQEIILRRMHELHMITEEEMNEAIAEPLNFRRGEDEVFERVVYTWFEEAIIRDVISDLMDMGHSRALATRILYTGGLRIISNIDLSMQAVVDEIYQNMDNLPRVTGSTQPLQSAIIIADPYTGAIRALAGGTGRKTQNMLLNRATQTRRPPGSAIKPLSIFAPALEFGFVLPTTLYDDSPYVTLSGTTWMPRNADRSFSGIVDVTTALRRSLNTVPAVMLDEMGPPMAYSFLRDAMGFTLNPADEDFAPLAAGQLTNGATVREMASGFTAFVNGGERVELRTYARIYNPDGSILIDNTPRSVRVMSENNANMMTDMLVQAVVNGTGGGAIIGGGMPVAGKTGTSTDSQDRWFVGYTPHYLAAVWTGFDRPARMVSQGNPAAAIFRMVMQPIHADLENRQFPRGTIPTGAVRTHGGIETVEYTVRMVDTMGQVIRTDSRRAPVGREFTISHPYLQFYVVQGPHYHALTLSNNPSLNVVTFVYRWVGPPTEEAPADYPPDETAGTGEEYTTPPPEDTTAPPETTPPEDISPPPTDTVPPIDTTPPPDTTPPTDTQPPEEILPPIDDAPPVTDAGADPAHTATQEFTDPPPT